MSKIKFDQNTFYHIYNRSIDWEKLFISEDDYFYFKKKLDKFITPIADIYAYCLLPTHFHLVIRTKQLDEIESKLDMDCFDKAFNNLFNSYVRSFNKAHHRHGRLFQQSFKYKIIKDEDQLLWTTFYTHRNPVHHGYVEKCYDWEYSSYNDLLHNQKDLIDYGSIIGLHSGLDSLISFTEDMTNEYKKEKLINDFDQR